MKSPPWTREEDERMYALKARGVEHKGIAIALGRTKAGVDNRIYTLAHEHLASRPELCMPQSINRKPARRRCLRCHNEFPSEGPHNRICESCKHSDSWRSLPPTVFASPARGRRS